MDNQPKQKTIFILGAGVMQIPAINIAKRNGWKVLCADQNINAPARDLPDFFIHADIKDSDLLIHKIETYNKENDAISGVFTCGTDFSLSVAKVAKHFNLPGIDPLAAEKATDKTKMREAFHQHQVNSPWFYSVKSAEDAEILLEKGTVSFPCVVKPVDSMGARGVIRINAAEELIKAVIDALKFSRSGRVIIEDFIPGDEFSLDAIIDNGEIILTGIADRHIYFPPYFIEMGHTMPSSQPDFVQQAVIAEFKKGIKALGLTLGAAKGDIKWDGKRAVVGEIAARLSGGYMSGWTYPYSSGIYPIDMAMRLAMGEHCTTTSSPWLKISAERAFISIPGSVQSINGIESVESTEGIKNVFLNIAVGERVRFPQNNVEKCGNVISCDIDYEKAVSLAEEAAQRIFIRLEPQNHETVDFLDGEKESVTIGDQFSFEIDSNIIWMDKLSKGIKWDFENLEKIISKIHGFSGENNSLFIGLPPALAKENDLDWQGRRVDNALKQVSDIFSSGVQSFDLVFSNENEPNGTSPVLTAYFWQALMRGSVQGAVWFLDRCSGSFKS